MKSSNGDEMKRFGFATRAIHAGQVPDPATGAIMTPIFQTSTYVQESPGKFKGYDYSRTANPTRTAWEANLASLEGGNFGLAFSSGCASLDAVLHLLSTGDHVVLGDDVYGGTFRLFDKVFKRLGIDFTRVDLTDLVGTERAFKSNTKLLWLETPTNPMLKVADIRAISQICKKRSVLLAVDNTFATPFLQRPLELGADIVSHSCTKYLGGHSDLVSGALVVNDAGLAEQLHFIQNAVGAVPSPFECFLLLRSTKTLPVRIERHCSNATRIATWLSEHKGVSKVIYPGLESHPNHLVARGQMSGFGGMITIYLKGDLNTARKFLERVKIFSLAESLGGVESLIEHPAIMTHASIPSEERIKLGISDTLVRLSVGIESVDDLIGDLQKALDS